MVFARSLLCSLLQRSGFFYCLYVMYVNSIMCKKTDFGHTKKTRECKVEFQDFCECECLCKWLRRISEYSAKLKKRFKSFTVNYLQCYFPVFWITLGSIQFNQNLLHSAMEFKISVQIYSLRRHEYVFDIIYQYRTLLFCQCEHLGCSNLR